MKHFSIFSFVAGTSAIAFVSATPAQAKPIRSKAQCVAPAMKVSLRRESFVDPGAPGLGPPITLSPKRESAIISHFKLVFSSTFQNMCRANDITPKLFAKFKEVELESASGDTDGHFFEDETKSSKLTFSLYYGSGTKTDIDSMVYAISCFAKPSSECYSI